MQTFAALTGFSYLILQNPLGAAQRSARLARKLIFAAIVIDGSIMIDEVVLHPVGVIRNQQVRLAALYG